MARILIVDDNVSLRLVLAELLHDAGHEVIQASDGVQALEELMSASPDLVLTDIHMPRLDGLSLLQQAQSISAAPRWILMSASLRRPTAFSVPFLFKPFEFEELLALINRVLIT